MGLQKNEVWVEAGFNIQDKRYWYYKYIWDEAAQSWSKVEQSPWGTEGKFLFSESKPLGKHVYKKGTTEKHLQEQGVTPGYGLESLSKEDFYKEDGITQKTPEEIVALIKKHKPNTDKSDEDIYKLVVNELPKLGEVSEEDKQFAREDFKKDVYGVSKDAGKAGAEMQKAYGSGMGSQMRGAYGAQKDVAQQYSFAEQGYEEDIYGLEQKQAGEFESNIGTFLANFKQGGRVPSNKKTFLDVLSKIPDAGGN